MDRHSSSISYAASASALIFGLSASEFAAIVGAICAVLTFVVNWWFKYQQLKVIERRVNLPFPSINVPENE